jgi:hypothetical protein
MVVITPGFGGLRYKIVAPAPGTMAEATPVGDVSRTRLALLAVAGLVALAGCGAVLPGGDASPDPDPDLEPADPPYATSLEDSTLIADHLDALREAGSFTLERNTTIESDSGAGAGALMRVRVGLEHGVVAWTQRPDPVAQFYRFPNGTSYVSMVADGSRSYRRNPARDRDAVSWARTPVSDVLEAVAFEHAGAMTSRGERVHVYRATEPSAANASALVMATEPDDVVGLNATRHVRESGLVTRVDVRYVVEIGDLERAFSWRTRFSEFGATDTSPPAWVDDARRATRNESA